MNNKAKKLINKMPAAKKTRTEDIVKKIAESYGTTLKKLAKT
jgi:hypothetical protein